MIAKLVSVIEVESGGVRRYFTTEGESVGALADGAAYGHPMPTECTYCGGWLTDGERLIPGAVVRPSSGEGWCTPTCAHAWCGGGPANPPAEERREANGRPAVPMTAQEVIDLVPKRRYVPPFDPSGPGLRMGGETETGGDDE